MDKLLTIENLKIQFGQGKHVINAVNGASLDISPGEILGLVGESGSGKTMAALSLTRILPEGARITGGRILFRGKDLLRCDNDELRAIRGKEISYIFQEATASLNPVLTINRQIQETLTLHADQSQKGLLGEAEELLKMARLSDPQAILRSYPHQLSGGMNQRVMIAMALASRPHLLIADEPTTALDVTIEKEIIQMLVELKQNLGFSILFITHNLFLVKRFADRIAIMFKGEIVEEAAAEDIFKYPRHQHTKELISSMI